MKTTQLFFTGLFVLGGLFVQAQSTQTSTLTRFGLQAGTGGTGNAFFGYQAGMNTTGSYNTFVGNGINLVGSHQGNTYVGYNSGSGGSGNYNVFIGHNSGYIAEGTRNVIIGARAGNHTEGDDNIFIGYITGNDNRGSRNIYIGKYVGDSVEEDDILKIENSGSSVTAPLIWGDFAEDLLKFNGKVGVGYGFGSVPNTAGTVNVSGYNLFVNGGILTEEVRVMLKSDWADYVFEENYNLLKLEEIEEFIKENKRLPNVPSAQEVSENGIELGEIATIQQEKIEELTLYLIEQNKLIKQQQQDMERLKKQVELLLENKKP